VRKFASGCVIAAALGSLAALPACAADISRSYPAPAPYSAFSWAGLYLGANVGYQWGSVANSNTDPHGVLGGLQLGYNWQYGNFVYGLETDAQLSNANDTSGIKFSNPWFGTTRGKLGYAFNNMLFYGTGGLAYGSTKAEWAGVSESHAHFGWTVGAGAEVGLTPNWSAKVEYLFVNLADERYALTGLDHDFASSLLRFGFNFRF
jgi:outer membrane immunogenic protein